MIRPRLVSNSSSRKLTCPAAASASGATARPRAGSAPPVPTEPSFAWQEAQWRSKEIGLEVAARAGGLVAPEAGCPSPRRPCLASSRHVALVGELDPGRLAGDFSRSTANSGCAAKLRKWQALHWPSSTAARRRAAAPVVDVAARAVDLRAPPRPSARSPLPKSTWAALVSRPPPAGSWQRWQRGVGDARARRVALLAAALEVRVRARSPRPEPRRRASRSRGARAAARGAPRAEDQRGPEERPLRAQRRVVRAAARRAPAHPARHQYQSQAKTWTTSRPISRPGGRHVQPQPAAQDALQAVAARPAPASPCRCSSRSSTFSFSSGVHERAPCAGTARGRRSRPPRTSRR